MSRKENINQNIEKQADELIENIKNIKNRTSHYKMALDEEGSGKIDPIKESIEDFHVWIEHALERPIDARSK